MPLPTTACSTATEAPFTTIDVAGPGNTFTLGINNAGQIVGYFDFYGGPTHGYLFDTDGSYTTIDPPGSGYAYLFGINNAGQIVGGATGVGGFLYSGGSFTTIAVPGASSSTPLAINDAGQILVLVQPGSLWFVATPAQSPSLARLLGGPSTNQPNTKMGGSNVLTSPAKSNR